MKHFLLTIGIICLITSCSKNSSAPPVVPGISSFAPQVTGPGYQLTIAGSNFSATASQNTVTINGVSATVVSASSGVLKVTVPDGATSGKIAISVNGQTTTSGASLQIVKLTVSAFAGSGVAGATDGPGSTASFNGLFGIACDAGGNLFVNDAFNNKIRKITPDGTVSTFAGTGAEGNTDGPVATATFKGLKGICFDKAGNIYVSNGGYKNIRKITTDNMVSTFAGSLTGASGQADGTGTAATFGDPENVVTDANNYVFVADEGNQTIRKITPGATVTTFAGSSNTPGLIDGTAGAAKFSSPEALGIDPSNNLFVGESFNNTIRKVTPGAVVTTYAGNGTRGNEDGTGVTSFYYPSGIAVDASGNLFVVDRFNRSIRMVKPSGEVATLAGGNIQKQASIAGVGYNAAFSDPTSIAIDKNGVLYVTDYGGNKVMKITVQ